MSGEDEKEWIIDEDGEAKKKELPSRKIKIEVGRDHEVDSLHEELSQVKQLAYEGDNERAKAQAEINALEKFEIQKEYEAKIQPRLSEQILKTQSPQELEALIWHNQPVISGKASMEQLQKPNDNQSLDEIYTILNFPKDYSKEQIKDAEAKRRTLIKTLFSSPSIETMRREGKTVYAKNTLMYCPICQRNDHVLSTINVDKNEKCSRCGYTPNEDEQRR
jgi:glutamate synthase domain-containing protein 3